MRKLILSLSVLAIAAITFTSCKKKCHEPKKHECFCGSKEDKDEKKHHDKFRDHKDFEVTKYVLEPVVIDETCGCPTSGKIKFVGDGPKGERTTIVDFGIEDKDLECDNWAMKTTTFKGKFGKEKKVSCKWQMDCSKEMHPPKDGEKASTEELDEFDI